MEVDQLVNAVYGNNLCLFRDSYETSKYTLLSVSEQIVYIDAAAL
jgi:hypothetical protein